MIGSGVVAFPMTFMSSGFGLGIVVCVVGVLICSRTCILMLRTAGDDKEYFDTLYKYWGKWAYYLGAIATIAIMFAAVCSYFIIMSQMMYPICALIFWIFGTELTLDTTTSGIGETLAENFTHFSPSYCVLVLLIIEIYVTSRRDLSIFIKLVSFGTFFIVALILFIIGYGIYGFTNTEYQISMTHSYEVNNNYSPDTDVRYIYVINNNFSTLAGMLGIGYFLHTVSIPIVRNNKNQENNERDVTIGYMLVAGTYVIVGVMGYFGFMGAFFSTFYTKQYNPDSSLSFD